MEKLIELLKQQEGYRRKVYKCTEGFHTIAYGRNLDTNGIDEEEAEYLLRRDVVKCQNILVAKLDFWGGLNQPTRDALTNMAFQLGINGLLKFKNMLSRLDNGDYYGASREALNSRWARQTPNRAKHVAKMIETGEY